MKGSHGRHGGNQGKTDKHEAEQARQGGLAESLSGVRDEEDAQGHTSGRNKR